MNSRNQSLDVLRGIAVLLVIANHYRYYIFCRVGWIGVDLFFVLSGFLISGLLFSDLQAHGKISLSRFFIRRGLKIYPAFYVFLGFTALIVPMRQGIFSEIFFLQSYLPRMWGHTWSLAVEEHFYIALPLILLLLVRFKRLTWIPAISGVLVVACLGLRIVTALHSTEMEAVLCPTHLRIDALFAGVTLGYFYHFRREEFMVASRVWVIWFGLLLLLPSLLTDTSDSLLFSIQALMNLAGFAMIVLWAVPRKLHLAPIAQIGEYSYSVYLWHLLVTAFWRNYKITFVTFWADVLTCLAVGIAMALMVETPVLHLRDRFFPRRAVAVGSSFGTALQGSRDPECGHEIGSTDVRLPVGDTDCRVSSGCLCRRAA
jgi:peptidoglycan/LPS O-acetylase OafA/YrhL